MTERRTAAGDVSQPCGGWHQRPLMDTVGWEPHLLLRLLDALPVGLALAELGSRSLYVNPAWAGWMEGEREGPLPREVERLLWERACPAAARGALTVGGEQLIADVGSRQGRLRIGGIVVQPSGTATPLLALTIQPAPMRAGWPDDVGLRYRLTPAELRVAELVAAGLSNGAVAAALSISPHTARTHTARILSKIGVRSRAGISARLRGDER